MSDHIQANPPARLNYEPEELQDSHDPTVAELRRRVRGLERDKRRWKVIGITALIALVLMVIGGGLVVVSAVSYSAYRGRAAQMQAEMEERRAEMEWQRAQEALELAKPEAERRAGKEAK